MLPALTLLLGCQLTGEVLVRLLQLPLPGPLLGLVLLLALLVLRGGAWPGLEATVQGILGNFSLLFVPAGVGLIVHLDRLAAEWLPLLAALVGSTVLTLVVTALVFRLVSRLTGDDPSGNGPPGNAPPGNAPPDAAPEPPL